MKKLSIVMMLILAVCWLTGCVSNQIDPPTAIDQANAESIGNPYLITEEEALANLEAFFAANTQGQTRTSTTMPRVKKITGIRNHDRVTRSETGDSTTLLYIANFDDEQGFALLSADKRVSSLVVGVSEKGEISEEILEYYDRLLSERPLFKGFPLDGPGFFTDTVPGGGTETFINPNTVNFYIEEEDDYLIGDLDTSEYELLNQSNQPTIQTYNPIELFIVDCAINYVKDCINRHDDDNTNLNFKHTPDDYEPSLVDPWIGGTGDMTETDVAIVGPLLSDFVGWRQNPDLNIFFPSVGGKDHAYTGCYPLAIAKVLAHNRKPETYTYHGHTFDWNIINNYRFGPSDEAALFLRAVADGCNPWYFSQGTFVFPKRAERFFRRCGYSNVHNLECSFDKIKNMIDNNKPLAISGMPKWKFYKAHAWNIDGYRTSKRGIYDIQMIHCDFGWGGMYNGYYVSNVFNLGDEDNIYDNDNHYGNDQELNHYNRILVYD